MQGLREEFVGEPCGAGVWVGSMAGGRGRGLLGDKAGKVGMVKW